MNFNVRSETVGRRARPPSVALFALPQGAPTRPSRGCRFEERLPAGLWFSGSRDDLAVRGSHSGSNRHRPRDGRVHQRQTAGADRGDPRRQRRRRTCAEVCSTMPTTAMQAISAPGAKIAGYSPHTTSAAPHTTSASTQTPSFSSPTTSGSPHSAASPRRTSCDVRRTTFASRNRTSASTHASYDRRHRSSASSHTTCASTLTTSS